MLTKSHSTVPEEVTGSIPDILGNITRILERDLASTGLAIFGRGEFVFSAFAGRPIEQGFIGICIF